VSHPKAILEAFGFYWNPVEVSFPVMADPDTRRAIWRAKKIFAEIIHDITVLEGNPFTVPEIQTLLEGITVGGHKVSEAQQVMNQKESLLALFNSIEREIFDLTPEIALKLQSIAARGEALEEGVFRSGKVSISGTDYLPPVGIDLRQSFESMAVQAKRIENLFERAMAVFLFVARMQCFWDGNKRTGRLLMNGLLLQSGQDLITIPSSRQLEFNQKMLRFYESAEATEMMAFLSQCQIRSKFE
jgi:Fic family protein